MKIAFITEHFNPGLGGAETYMSEFGKYLINEGHEVHFFTQDDIGDYAGLKFHIIKVSGLARKVRWLQWTSFLKKARKEAEKENFDIIMGTGKCLGVNVFQPHGGTVRASHRQNALLVRNSFHIFMKNMANKISPKHIVAKWIEKQQYSRPGTRFVAISEMVRSHMKEFYNISDSNIDLIYNGIDTSRFSPSTEEDKKEARRKLELPEDKTIFSIVAHNFKLKGIKELIDMVLHIGRTSLSFEIAYHIVPKEPFSQIVDEFGYSVYAVALKHRIECYGYIFEEAGPDRSILKEECEKHNVPLFFYSFFSNN